MAPLQTDVRKNWTQIILSKLQLTQILKHKNLKMLDIAIILSHLSDHPGRPVLWITERRWFKAGSLDRNLLPCNLTWEIWRLLHMLIKAEIVLQVRYRYFCTSLLQFEQVPFKPWSSGKGKRLTFQRSWVRIPAPYTGWTFFPHIFVVKIVMMFVWKDRK